MIEKREGLQWSGGVSALRRSESDVGKIEIVEYVDDTGSGVLMIGIRSEASSEQMARLNACHTCFSEVGKLMSC